MRSENIISLKNAALGYTKSGSEVTILHGIDLDFTQGDFVAIVGINGTGKSTLLKSLCGLLPLLSGQLTIDGKDISALELATLAKKISVVLTDKIGGFNLTAFDVVAAGQMPYTNAFNQLKKEHLDVIEAAMDACGIREHQNKLVNELSDGLFQKTIIAKALAQQTPVMLLDEPSAFLDYASKHELFLLLKKLADEDKKCILVSSHDLDLALKYCNRLLIISSGGAELIAVSEARKNDRFLKIGGGYI